MWEFAQCAYASWPTANPYFCDTEIDSYVEGNAMARLFRFEKDGVTKTVIGVSGSSNPLIDPADWVQNLDWGEASDAHGSTFYNGFYEHMSMLKPGKHGLMNECTMCFE